MRTNVYIDGYNLYYGRLQGTPYKWLDVRRLVQHILQIQDPNTEIALVKFFTAPVLGRLASHEDKSVAAQDAYHRALLTTGIEIIKGRHTLEQGIAPRFEDGKTASRQASVPIWKWVEKETDVNLALHMYRDAVAATYQKSIVEQLVLVSSDTDASPALRMIREDFPNLKLGIIFPLKPAGSRPTSGSLSNVADWSRHHILDQELADSQFKDSVATDRKPARKPDYW